MYSKNYFIFLFLVLIFNPHPLIFLILLTEKSFVCVRYKIYIEGLAWSVSDKYILACDSMTLLVRPRYYDFFIRGMVPLEHYWPIRDNSKCTSLKFAVEWGNNHTEKVTLSLSLSVEMFSHKVCIQPTNLMGLVFHRFGLNWFFLSSNQVGFWVDKMFNQSDPTHTINCLKKYMYFKIISLIISDFKILSKILVFGTQF